MGALGFGPIACKGERLRFSVYDMEWYPHSMKVRLCGVYDGKRYRSYQTVGEFLDGELTSRNRGAVFFAHAGGLSDVQFVFEEILRRRDPELTVDVSFSGSSAVIVRVKKGKNAWTFADSYWVLKASLRDIGRLIGMEKGGQAESVAIFYAPLHVLREYNANDCRILYQALRQFEDETIKLGGELRLTIASCAMYLFRAAFMQQTIPTHGRVNDVARRAYVASRVEVFSTQCGAARVYDINSSFPKSMTHPLPGRMLRTTRSLDVPRVGGKPLYPGEPCYLADLTVSVPHGTYIPPLPKREGERVFFPTGAWRGWFSTPDVEALLTRIKGGRILAVHEVIHFEPFTEMCDYVNTLYARKAQATRDGNSFRAIVFKYYLNTLYGKTAESRLKETLVIGARGGLCAHNPPCEYGPDGRLPCVRMIRPGVFLRQEEVTISHEWVPIAAHVTSRSRLAHLDLLLACVDPAYGDTDCGVMPVECGSLPTGEGLGELKLEREIDGGVFLAPKLYLLKVTPTEKSIRKRMAEKSETEEEAKEALSASIRAKGFRRLTPAEFETLASGDPVLVGRMLRTKETLSGDIISPREHYYWKALRRTTRPKRAAVNATRTRPWTVEELAKKWEAPRITV